MDEGALSFANTEMIKEVVVAVECAWLFKELENPTIDDCIHDLSHPSPLRKTVQARIGLSEILNKCLHVLGYNEYPKKIKLIRSVVTTSSDTALNSLVVQEANSISGDGRIREKGLNFVKRLPNRVQRLNQPLAPYWP